MFSPDEIFIFYLELIVMSFCITLIQFSLTTLTLPVNSRNLYNEITIIFQYLLLDCNNMSNKYLLHVNLSIAGIIHSIS